MNLFIFAYRERLVINISLDKIPVSSKVQPVMSQSPSSQINKQPKGNEADAAQLPTQPSPDIQQNVALDNIEDSFQKTVHLTETPHCPPINETQQASPDHERQQHQQMLPKGKNENLTQIVISANQKIIKCKNVCAITAVPHNSLTNRIYESSMKYILPMSIPF